MTTMHGNELLWLRFAYLRVLLLQVHWTPTAFIPKHNDDDE